MTHFVFKKNYVALTEMDPKNSLIFDTSFARGVNLTWLEYCRLEAARMNRRGGHAEAVEVDGMACVARRKTTGEVQ